MRVMRGGHFWQLGSIASPATKTTGGVILVAFWPKHGLRSDLRVRNLKTANDFPIWYRRSSLEGPPTSPPLPPLLRRP